MAILVVCGAAVAVWVLARGDLVGADARAYWGGVRLWLGGGDPLDPPPPYLPYVYWSWSLPLFAPWAALPWETAWFVYRAFNVILLVWSVAWSYRQHPLATALLFLLITPALAATLDTGNVTFLCAMGIWAAHFVGPRLGGFLWALAAALKWFPALLFLILPNHRFSSCCMVPFFLLILPLNRDFFKLRNDFIKMLILSFFQNGIYGLMEVRLILLRRLMVGRMQSSSL
jgi:hypothetical protein